MAVTVFVPRDATACALGADSVADGIRAKAAALGIDAEVVGLADLEGVSPAQRGGDVLLGLVDPVGVHDPHGDLIQRARVV